MPESNIDTTDKVIWVCRENIGRSPVAEAFWRRLYPSVPTMSFGIDVDQPGQFVREARVADVLVETMQTEHDIDISYHMRRSIRDYPSEALGKAALIVILAEPEVVPLELAAQPNAHTWEMPDMKNTGPVETRRIVNLILSSMETVYNMLPLDVRQTPPMSEQPGLSN